MHGRRTIDAKTTETYIYIYDKILLIFCKKHGRKAVDAKKTLHTRTSHPFSTVRKFVLYRIPVPYVLSYTSANLSCTAHWQDEIQFISLCV